MRKSVDTILGKIVGRDGIYLDALEVSMTPHELRFVGEINGALCEHNASQREWIKFEATFKGVKYYECIWEERCKWLFDSNIEVDEASSWVESLGLKGGYNEYLFATYDYIYRIAAKELVVDFSE